MFVIVFCCRVYYAFMRRYQQMTQNYVVMIAFQSMMGAITLARTALPA